MLAEHSYQVFRTYDFIFSRAGFSTHDILNVHNIGGGIDDLYAESGTEKNALQSFSGRLDYQLLHRYFLIHLLSFNHSAHIYLALFLQPLTLGIQTASPSRASLGAAKGSLHFD